MRSKSEEGRGKEENAKRFQHYLFTIHYYLLLKLVSVSNAEGPPVPIPNTEVKLCSAEDTYLATDRENRSMLTQNFIFVFLSKPTRRFP